MIINDVGIVCVGSPRQVAVRAVSRQDAQQEEDEEEQRACERVGLVDDGQLARQRGSNGRQPVADE